MTLKHTVFYIISFLVLIGKSDASNEFGTEYNITYDVQSSGTTYVTQEVRIINKQKDVIATNYSLSIKQQRIFDVTANDKDIELELKEEADNTIIKTTFKNYAIGQYKAKNVSISYKTNDITNKVGEVWNINIPKIQNLENVGVYNVTLKVPKTLGPQIYISPNPLKTVQEQDSSVYFFNKELLNNIGIDGAFGQKQVLNFKLDYILKNDSVFAKNMQIALPPEIEKRQSVYYTSIEPKPLNIVLDQDGNFLAQYQLGANETLKIQAIGSAEIYGEQIIPTFGGSFDQIPKNLIYDYTKEDQYWETKNPKVQELAGKFKDPNKTVSENSWKIYDYITKNLDYDFNLVKKDYIDRNGAARALNSTDKWACMEFTDSFIAIARAMGIPAREINGYAYAGEGENKPISIGFKSGDVLHAWPEFYDPAFGWVAVDPTWGTTSGLDYFTRLDTNHFVFAIKGQDSTFPLPAGAYKIDGSEKQVEVEYALKPTTKLAEPRIVAYNTLLQNPVKLLNKQRAYYVKNFGSSSHIMKNGDLIPPLATRKVYVENLNFEKSKDKEFLLGMTAKSTFGYITAFFVALVLCMILILSIIHSKDLKKGPRHLHRRLRGQDQ